MLVALIIQERKHGKKKMKRDFVRKKEKLKNGKNAVMQ